MDDRHADGHGLQNTPRRWPAAPRGKAASGTPSSRHVLIADPCRFPRPKAAESDPTARGRATPGQVAAMPSNWSCSRWHSGLCTNRVSSSRLRRSGAWCNGVGTACTGLAKFIPTGDSVLIAVREPRVGSIVEYQVSPKPSKPDNPNPDAKPPSPRLHGCVWHHRWTS